MSTDLRNALRASMEDDDEVIHGTDGSHETDAPQSADAVVQPEETEIVLGEDVDPKALIEAAVQGEETATSLDEVADKADELVANDDASTVSAEMLALHTQHLLKPLQMDSAMVSFESEGDVHDYHRKVAERCRLIADKTRQLSVKLREQAAAK